MTETDARLVELAREGDRDAFEVLVRRHVGAAYAVALATLGEPAEAEDATQDALIRALERLDDCREPARFGAWLITIARNRAYSLRRRRRVRQAEPLEHVRRGDAKSDTAAVAERNELRERLARALETLSEVQREVVLLHDLEGWTHREIGERLMMPEGTVRSHLFYARRALRERLGQGFYAEELDETRRD